MANSFFRFKKFIVHQDKAAMKVCTDACLFGAYVATWLQQRTAQSEAMHLLDIGTGTGLLSLMLAQKIAAQTDAVEIDEAAAQQAGDNFIQSPWSERLKITHTGIQEFQPSAKTYDFIISNPPFFENDLRSSRQNRNLALHSEALTLDELLLHIKRLLTKNGSFALLLPYHRAAYVEKLAAQHHFFTKEKVLVKQTPRHPFFRAFFIFETISSTAIVSEITIRNGHNDYTPEFIQLLKDYYLHL